jgi:hypothetical protein
VGIAHKEALSNHRDAASLCFLVLPCGGSNSPLCPPCLSLCLPSQLTLCLPSQGTRGGSNNETQLQRYSPW